MLSIAPDRMPTDPVPAAHANLLLASLPARERQLIEPHLTRRRLAPGDHLPAADADAGGAADASLVYFPETAVICVRADRRAANGLGLGVIGRDGVFGWSALIGGEFGRQFGAVQLGGGTALTIGSDRLAQLCATEPALLNMLLRFAYLFSLQLADTLLSNVRDPIEARLSRWILMFHDRLDDNELAITHDALAALLSVRRATVTDTLHVLEGEHLVRCTRGRIEMRSREALRLRAGDAYGMAEHAYAALIGSLGR